MSGLDNIVEEIRNQSKQEADEILKEADVFCKDYMNKIKKDVEVEVVSIEKKALADRKLYEEKTVSGMEFLERNSILRAKQQVIEQAIDKARESIAGLNDEEYFNVLEKLLRKKLPAKRLPDRPQAAPVNQSPRGPLPFSCFSPPLPMGRKYRRSDCSFHPGPTILKSCRKPAASQEGSGSRFPPITRSASPSGKKRH